MATRKTFVTAENLPRQNGAFVPAGSRERATYTISRACGTTTVKGRCGKSVVVFPGDVIAFEEGSVTKISKPAIAQA